MDQPQQITMPLEDLIKNAVVQIEQTVSKLKKSGDVFKWYNSVLQIETDENLLFLSIYDLASTAPRKSFLLLLQLLNERFLFIKNSTQTTTYYELQTPAIMIFLLAEILVYIPVQSDPAGDSNDQITKILIDLIMIEYDQINYMPDFNEHFKRDLRRIVGVADFLGPDLLIKLYSKLEENSIDLLQQIKKMSVTLNSIASFKQFLKISETFLVAINKLDRPTLYQEYYSAISHFLTHNPILRKEMIVTGVSEAQSLFLVLKKTKIIEPQLLPSLCLILPFCAKSCIPNLKMKKITSLVFKPIQGFGPKKEPLIQYFSLNAFEELMESMYFMKDLGENDELLKLIKEFVAKNEKEFEPYLYSNLELSTPDKSLSSLFARYASYKLVATRTISGTKPVELLISKATSTKSWIIWSVAIEFFSNLFIHWDSVISAHEIIDISQNSKPPNEISFLNLMFNESIIMCESCLKIMSKLLEDESAKNFIYNFLGFIGHKSPLFSLYSICELHDQNNKIQVDFPNQIIALFQEISIEGSQIETFVRFISTFIVNCYTLHPKWLKTSISCLRNLWTFHPSFSKGKTSKSLLLHIDKVLRIFYENINQALKSNSPNYRLFTPLMYRFLHWSYKALSITMKNESKEQSDDMTPEIAQSFLNASLIIHSISSGKLLCSWCNNCDNLIKRIFKLYSNIDHSKGSPISYTSILYNSDQSKLSYASTATKDILETWIDLISDQTQDFEEELFTPTGLVKDKLLNEVAKACATKPFVQPAQLSLQPNTSSISNSFPSSGKDSGSSSQNNSPNEKRKSGSYSIQKVEKVRQILSNRNIIASLTNFLCRFLGSLSSDNPEENLKNKELKAAFLTKCFSYIRSLPGTDKSFTSSFYYLNNELLELFIEESQKGVFENVSKFGEDRQYFWMNIIHICTMIASRKDLKEPCVKFIDDVIPAFFSIIQFNICSRKYLLLILNAICTLISTFYDTISSQLNENQYSYLYSKRRLNIYSLLEICIYYDDSNQSNFNDIWSTSIKTLPSLFRDFDLAITSFNTNIDDASCEERLVKDTTFFLTTFNMFITNMQNEEIVSCIMKCMNYMITNTPSCWPVFSYFANNYTSIFKMLLIESLTYACGTACHCLTKPNLSQIDMDSDTEKSGHLSPRSQNFDRIKKEKNELYSMLIKMKARIGFDSFYQVDFNQSLPYRELTKPYLLLTENSFQFFKDNKLLNPHLIESCISCIFFYSKQEMLFEEMAKLASDSIFDSINSISIFFLSWFTYTSRKWQLTSLVNSVSVQNPNLFIEKFDPPLLFAYYVAKFAKLTSKELCEKMIFKSFFEPLLTCPLKYDVKKYISNDESKEFISKLVDMTEYKDLLQTLINTELIYPEISTDQYPNDRLFVLSYVSDRPRAMDKLYGIINEAKTDNCDVTKIQDVSILSLSNWISDAGTINDKKVIYIRIPNIQHTSSMSITSDFFNHFSSEINWYDDGQQKLIFLIDSSAISEKDSIFEAFVNIIQNAPSEFASRIEKVCLLNPSLHSVKILNEKLSSAVQKDWISKIEIINDPYSYISKENSTVYLPIKVFSKSQEKRGSIEVIYEKRKATFSICDDYFVLSSECTLFDEIKTAYHTCFYMENIVSMKEINDSDQCTGVVITYHSPINGMNTYILETKHGKGIIIAHAILYQRHFFSLNSCRLADTSKTGMTNLPIKIAMTPLIEANDITLFNCTSLQVQMLAYSLYQLSSTESTKVLGFQVFELFDAAFNFDTYTGFKISKTFSYENESYINLLFLFKMIEQKSPVLLTNVAYVLSYYLDSSTTSESLSNLLPIFLRVMNISNNEAVLNKIVINVLKTGNKQPHSSLIERLFFIQFENDLAFKVSIPILIRSTKSVIASKQPKGKTENENKIDNTYIEVYIRTLMDAKPQLVCTIINDMLDGTIRRRFFGNSITPDKIFTAIGMIPFHSNEFIKSSLSLFLFSIIMDLIYTAAELKDYVYKALNFAFASLLHSNAEKESTIVVYTQNILNLIENPRILKFSDLISQIDGLLSVIDEKQQQEFRNYLTIPAVDENQRNWYIKGFGEVYFGKGTNETTKRFIRIIPELFHSSEYPCQKLALCLDSISILYLENKIDDSNHFGHYLYWISLIGSTHPNTRLRESSIQLLNYIAIQTPTHTSFLEKIHELENSRKDSADLDMHLNVFEELMNVNFRDSFYLSFISILIRGMRDVDIEGRNYTLNFMKHCVTMLKNKIEISALFILPIITFDNSFYVNSTTAIAGPVDFASFLTDSSVSSGKILEWIGSNLDVNMKYWSTIPELIFHNFSQRKPNEKKWIVSFLERFFGENSCPYSVGVLAEIIIHGVQNFGTDFVIIHKSIFEKCQNMIDAITQSEAVDKLAKIMAAFIQVLNTSNAAIESSESQPDIYKRPEEEKLNDLISKILEETVKLMQN